MVRACIYEYKVIDLLELVKSMDISTWHIVYGFDKIIDLAFLKFFFFVLGAFLHLGLRKD